MQEGEVAEEALQIAFIKVRIELSMIFISNYVVI